MADAVLYSSMDVGGPGSILQPNDRTNGVQGFYNLLVPCLVTGYGSGASAKPGQGWTLVHADLPTGFTLKAPDGVFYVFCKGPSQTYAYTSAVIVWMAEKLAAPYTYPPVGDNVRSGDHSVSYSTSNYRHWVCCCYYGFQIHAWYLVARGPQVQIHVTRGNSNNSTVGDISSGSGDSPLVENGIWGFSLLLGGIPYKDPLIPSDGPQNAMILGGYSSKAQQATWNPSSETFGNCFYRGLTRVRNPISGVIEKSSLPFANGLPSKHSADGTYKAPMDVYPADIMLQRVDFWEDGQGAIGYIPGLFYMPRNSHRRFGEVAPLLGKASSYAETLIPYTIAGEPFYFIPVQWGTIVLSLLEKYW